MTLVRTINSNSFHRKSDRFSKIMASGGGFDYQAIVLSFVRFNLFIDVLDIFSEERVEQRQG